MRRFDQELSELHHQLIEMGTLAESMVTTAVKALEDLTQDVEEALQTSEDMLDEMQNIIDKEVVRILTVYSPSRPICDMYSRHLMTSVWRELVIRPQTSSDCFN